MGKDVLNTNVCDGERDEWFDDTGWQTDDAVHREAQGESVGNGEHGDLPQQGPDMYAEQKYSQDKQDMILKS